MTTVTRTRLLIVIGTVGVATVFLHFLGALNGPESWLAERLARPEAHLADAGRSLRKMITSPFKVMGIIEENDALKEERDRLLVEISRLNKADEENRELRALLDFSERERQTPVMAHVLAQTPQAGRHTILLDKGSDSGLSEDMPVIVGNSILIGKILSVQEKASLALLLTDTRSHVGGLVENDDRTVGVVQGIRGLSLEMRLIPQNQDIQPDDLVVTSGIEPLVPRGLVLGKVQSVEVEERNPFKRATIVSPVDFDLVEIVAVLFPG